MEHTEELLSEKVARFNALIEEQAHELVERACAGRLHGLSEALAAFGVLARPVARFVEVWEDIENGRLPPKLICELDIPGEYGFFSTRFELPVGAFHDNAKDEQIFELCMLRAEAYQELAGGGDGHALGRMRELEEMIDAGRVVFAG